MSGPEQSGQARPSIYVRLMPLMYGLIGATAALLFSSLLCGTPISPPAARGTACKPQGAPKTNARPAKPARQTVLAATSQTRPDADGAAGKAPGVAKIAPDTARGGGATKSVPGAPSEGPPPRAPAREGPPPSKAVKSVSSAPRLRTAAAPSSPTAMGWVKAAIGPCVRGRARSFRVAVRVQRDGEVRRVFVARDPGVNAAMTACIQRKLAAVSLPLKLPRRGYAEWRVRQTDGALSLTLIQPMRRRKR